MTPHEDLARVARAQRRFDEAIGSLNDDDVRKPSLCPGWSVGHVLAHVARNADSHVRRAEAAMRGEVVEQYPGGFEGRAAEIEAGAGRRAAELVADVVDSGQQVDATWRRVPDAAWANMTTDVGGRERPLHELVGRRWQELEVHLVDLDIGITHRDWPDEFVAAWLPRLRAYGGEAANSAEAATDLDRRDELAWLYGRLERPDLPSPPSWG